MVYRSPVSQSVRPALVALLVSAVVLACSGDSDSPGYDPATTSSSSSSSSGAAQGGFLRASITGSPTGKARLDVTQLPGAYAEYRDTPNGERVSIHANVPAGDGQFQKGEQSLRIFLQPYADLGTYTFGALGGGAYAELDAQHVFFAKYGESYADHGSGSIVIESRSADRLTGRFTLTGEDEDKAATVTLDGTFDLPLLADGG